MTNDEIIEEARRRLAKREISDVDCRQWFVSDPGYLFMISEGEKSAIAAHDYLWGPPGVLGSQQVKAYEAVFGIDSGDEQPSDPNIKPVEEIYPPQKMETESEKQERLWLAVKEFSGG